MEPFSRKDDVLQFAEKGHPGPLSGGTLKNLKVGNLPFIETSSRGVSVEDSHCRESTQYPWSSGKVVQQ